MKDYAHELRSTGAEASDERLVPIEAASAEKLTPLSFLFSSEGTPLQSAPLMFATGYSRCATRAIPSASRTARTASRSL